MTTNMKRSVKHVTLPDGRRATVPATPTDEDMACRRCGEADPFQCECPEPPKQQFPYSHHRIAARLREAGEAANL